MSIENDATRKGADAAVRRVGEDRMAAMDLIADKRRETVSKEAGVDIPAADLDADAEAEAAEKAKAELEAKAKAEEEAKKSKPDDQIEKQLAADDRVVLEGDLSRYVFRAKVDGEDQEIPLTKVTRALQKDFAADKRLEDATRQRKEAEAKNAEAQAALDAARSAGNQDEIAKAKAKAAEAASDLDEVKHTIKAATDALFAGDVEAATEHLYKAVQSRRESEPSPATAPDADQIASVVIAKVEQRTALSKFAENYPEIVANDTLAAMADKEVKELMEHEGKSFAEAVDLAGKHVRQSIKDMAKGLGMSEASEKPTGARVDRQSRKSQIDEPSSARSAQASSTQEEQPKTPSDLIAEMRDARRGAPRPVT